MENFPSPLACHVMAKPAGSTCNLNCEYCFYLEKEKLYRHTNKDWRMSSETLDLYISQYIDSQDVPVVNFAWQGGEPTLMGIDFFKQAIKLQKKYAGGKTITNAFQTNGTLLNDRWGHFLSENNFLVGISIDGPREIHDHYRVNKKGQSSFDKVMAGLKILKKHHVEFNTLTALQSHNANHPNKIYHFLKDIGSRYMQFIPIVERISQKSDQDSLRLVNPQYKGETKLSKWTITPEQYGNFLCTIFDQWVRHDVGQYYIQLIDIILGVYLGQRAGLCVFEKTCGQSLILEHNGDLYSCDHYVYPENCLGNIKDNTIRNMVTSDDQIKFGMNKCNHLPEDCQKCESHFICQGGCPKHRFIKSYNKQESRNYLCQGYKTFFKHIDPYIKFMVNELRQNRSPANVMAWVQNKNSSHPPGRNEACPCGSGKKYKRCCR